MGKKLPYDKKNPHSIEEYSKTLIDKTFADVLADNFSDKELKEKIKYYNNPRAKGGLGNLLEKYFFYYEPNSESEPDFAEAGVELKVTPYEITTKNKVRAGERLVITMIPNREPVEENFNKSHLFKKIVLLLLVFYLRERTKNRTQYKIDYVNLFSLLSEKCKEDLLIIKDDYEKIIKKIMDGKAHELSEGDTKYLGACTKGSTAKKILQEQYYNSNILAKRRAFCLKQSYMTYVLNYYILNNISTSDSIFNEDELKNSDFETKVINKIRAYVGKTEEYLYSIFDINKKIKQRNNLLIMRMLGVKTDNAAEFEKADIEIKTIRVSKNGKPKESMSFPTIEIMKLVNEDFEDSEIYEYFSQKRFLFVVFHEDENGDFILKGAKFWNMPMEDLEGQGKKEWTEYRDKFKTGVTFQIEDSGNCMRIKNDLPTQKETSIFHMRPHASRAGYIIDGESYGSPLTKNIDKLPNGNYMTKQCFWFNKDYISKIIQDI